MQICLCGRTYCERYHGALVLCDNCVRSAELFRRPLYRCWLSGYCLGSTLATAPLYLRTLWRYTNAVIIIIIIIIIIITAY